jgi:levanase
MISPRFVIDRPHMSLRVGGGFHRGTRAELRVNGRVERTAVGIWEQQETLTRVVWDVSAFRGKEAQLYLIDEDSGSWAHLVCDHVVLY